MIRWKIRLLVTLLAVAGFSSFGTLFAKDPDYTVMELDNISRYTEDRLGYQQIQKWTNPYKDDSFAALLIIQKSKMHLLVDGYDNPRDVADTRRRLLIENVDYKESDLWPNKLNGKPDYVRVTDRRVELLKNFDEDYVSKNFGERYIKVRDALLQRHVQIFSQLMRNRKESGLTVVREPLPKPGYLGAPEQKTTKYFVSVGAKAQDGRVYYAEDADGDGITETFSVSIPDGFNWGYQSGPNVIFIYKNKEQDIQKIIGNITKEAYFGTAEEEKNIIETFPKDQDIIERLVKDAIRDEPKQ
jgi:hypothetical protein